MVTRERNKSILKLLDYSKYRVITLERPFSNILRSSAFEYITRMGVLIAFCDRIASIIFQAIPTVKINFKHQHVRGDSSDLKYYMRSHDINNYSIEE